MAVSPVAERMVELTGHYRPGCTLPQPFYTNPEFFERDLERIFFRHWLPAGHVARLPKPGGYFLYEIAGESIIITRGRDDEIHALWNVCRHRGSRICSAPEGRANSLKCPYHAWTYGCDGRLLSAPAMPDDFDRAGFGLKTCPVRVDHGIIQIYLGDDEPPELDSAWRDIEPFAAPYHLAEAKLAVRLTWELKANWKLVVENFAECYHCGPAHPEYCSLMDEALVECTQSPAKIEAYGRRKAAWEEQARAMGHFVGFVPASEDKLHCASRTLIGGNRLCPSRTGQPVAPIMGDFRQADGGYTSWRIHPAGYFLSPCDHGVLNRFTPLSVDRTLQEMIWLVHPDAVPGRDYDVDELTWLWRVTNAQDLKIIEDNQRGVASRGYQPGPYSKAEHGPARFVNWYLKQVRG
jgi:phenylpropionate dioxygenase-like ring-hydroxylating dioxygenase large terminal subunit